jgi:hypothetical protein
MVARFFSRDESLSQKLASFLGSWCNINATALLMLESNPQSAESKVTAWRPMNLVAILQNIQNNPALRTAFERSQGSLVA